jgi:acetyltransferase-like isoleucine patch superfamily enzyme
MRDAAKALARGFCLIAVSPALLMFVIKRPFLGADRALEGSSQSLAMIPGVTGQYLRRAFLARVLAHCAPTVTIAWGTVFSQTGARLDDQVYVGPGCHLGWVHLERDVLVAAGVHIPSGPDTHGIADLSRPIREQPGTPRLVRIGAGTWIGSGAIVMADVGADSVIAAGAVVTSAMPPRVIAGGVPARVLRSRDGNTP